MEDGVLDAARKRALEEHVSLAKYIEGAIRAKLAEEARDVSVEYRPIKTFKGNGVHDGIDLNDSARLLEVMEDV